MFEKHYKHQHFNDSFHRAIGPVILIGQCFGLMPVTGVLNPNPAFLKFRLLDIRTIIAVVNIASGLLFCCVTVYTVLLEGINLRNIVGIIFFVCCTTVMMLFLRLASKWRIIMRKWYLCEEPFIREPFYPHVGFSLYAKIRFISTVVFLIAAVEHILYNASNWYNMHFYTSTCNIEVDNWWQYFFKNNFIFMFNVLPYHMIISLYLAYSNFALTVSWNYMDLFIMLISIAITTRFKQMDRRLKLMGDKVLPEKIWEQVRCDYVLLCELVEYIDTHLAAIILLSCVNNLYFICFQLLSIFNSLPHAINKIYFWFSLLYLIGRTVFVYLCAASIHDSSRLPLEVIRTIPSNGWCGELERFMEQVRNELIALSGSNFFFMTRKLLFGIAATVVTYELVLLQFDQNDFNPKSGNSTKSHMCGN